MHTTKALEMAETPPHHVDFRTRPDRYKHWRLSFAGPVATLAMDVNENGGLFPDYVLKLNSYDLGVDIELADALDRLRFEHPEVRVVVVTSLKERIFCAGANIKMLGLSPHAFKVNFCKFTNETRVGIEDASENSGLKFLAALNGICAGGGYELALACDEIFLVDDGNSAVSLPEVPLLAVLPGTGGLTRLVDKRKVRRDRADFFCTVTEGIKGQRAADWGLVDQVVPKSKFDEAVSARAKALAAQSDRPVGASGLSLTDVTRTMTSDSISYGHVHASLKRDARLVEVTIKGPHGPQPESPEAIAKAGCGFWPFAMFRELNDLLLHLRLNEPEMGTLVIRTRGDLAAVAAVDETLVRHQNDWLVREMLGTMKRTLKRLDLSAKSVFALIDSGSCFAGTLFELVLAADRSYMLDDADQPTAVMLTDANGGLFPMSNGWSRLMTHFVNDEGAVQRALGQVGEELDAEHASELGLVTFTPDEIDWEDEVRLAIEERLALSPDALTGMEANLRFAGPETMETKIFGRLTAWQNWIFQRPNAVGERGGLKVYGKQGVRPEFDWRRT